MKARTITGRIKVLDLINMVWKASKQFNYNTQMESYFTGLISSGEEVAIPTIGYLAEMCPQYREEMISLYNGTMGLYEGVQNIPDDLKVAQAAVFDSLCFGFDCVKGITNLYTMRVDLFGDELEDKDLVKVMESNLKGEIKALKFSYEYVNNGCEIVDYKIGAHRTKIDNAESCILVPFMASTELLNILHGFMTTGMVVKVVQQLEAGEKVRCVTEKSQLLAKYCDDESIYSAELLKSLYYYLDGFFYAPVLGAPSTTSRMTNINIFYVTELRRLQNNKQLSELGVQKPKDPIGVEIQENMIVDYIMSLAEKEDINGEGAYEDYMKKVSSKGGTSALKKLVNISREEISPKVIKRYLHAMKSVDRTQFLKGIPNSTKIYKSRRDLYSENCREATEEEMQNLYQTFRNGICKVLIKKKDGTFSSMLCTNNQDILRTTYGEDYFKLYESIGVRARAVQEYLEENGDNLDNINVALAGCGFESLKAEDVLETTKEFSEDAYVNAIFKLSGSTRKASSSGNSIMVRGLSARLSSSTGKVEEYYKNVDPDKILKVFILG